MWKTAHIPWPTQQGVVTTMSKPPTKTMIVALLSLAAVAASGCIDPGATPGAALQLQSDVDEATTGQMVHFQAEADSNQTGNESGSSFLFDFGDGTTERVEGEGRAEAQHAFEAGGTYTVTVQLLSGNDTIASAEDAVHVVERIEHDAQAATSGPLSNQTDTATWDVPVGDNASLVESELRFENAALIGQSVVRVELVDADGEVVASEEVTLDEGATGNATLSAEAPGSDLVLRLVAESGGVSAKGDSTIRYE